MPKPKWADYTLTQGFGPTSEKLDGSYGGYANFNKGYDYGIPEGTAIDANIDGVVEAISDDPNNSTGWGKYVWVRDSEGNLHRFNHLSETAVNVGQRIRAGTVVGLSGNTGKSTGPHLSYDVSDPDGNFIDPGRFISGEPVNGRGSYGDIEFMGGGDTLNQEAPNGEGIHSIFGLPEDIFKMGKGVADAAAASRAQKAKMKPLMDARDRVAGQIQDYLSRGETPPPALVAQLRDFDTTMDAVTSGIWGDESGIDPQTQQINLMNMLGNIFQTAISNGTLTANAANSRISQELEQLPFRYDSEFMPGFEPGSMMAMMTPGYDKENFRGQKVPLTNPATITEGASAGMEDILQRILGMGESMGGGMGMGSGGSEMPPFYENPTGAAPPPVSTEGALGSLGAQGAIQNAMGAGNAILQQIMGFLYDDEEEKKKRGFMGDLGAGVKDFSMANLNSILNNSAGTLFR